MTFSPSSIIPLPSITPVANLPWSATADTVALDGSTSAYSIGATGIVSYLWVLFEQPKGVTGTWPTDPNAAYLTNATTATPTLNNVVLPGSYGIVLVVTDDNPDPNLSSSYTSHIPTQLTTAQDGLYGLEAFQFAGPVPSQIVWVRKEEQYTSLVKPGRGDRGWFSLTGGHWDLIEKVEDHEAQLFSEATGVRHYDTIDELTPDHGVIIEGVTVKDGDITVPDGNSIYGGATGITFDAAPGTITISGPTHVEFSGGPVKFDVLEPYSPDTGVAVRGDGTHTYDLAVDKIKADSNNSSVTVSGKGTHTCDLSVDVIASETSGNPVVVSGTGAHTYDLGVDIISPETNSSAVVVRGRGTHTADLVVDAIAADTTNGSVTVSGNGTHTYDLGVDIISPETDSTGVKVRGRGTHSFDLATDKISADTTDSYVEVLGSGTHTYDLSADKILSTSVAGATDLALGAGADVNVIAGDDVYVEGGDVVTIDARGGAGSGQGTITAIGKFNAQAGTSTSRLRVPVNVIGDYSGATSNGTTNQVVWSYTLPANSMIVEGDSIKGRITVETASNSNAKTARFKFGSTTIIERSFSNGKLHSIFDFIVTSKNGSSQSGSGFWMETNLGGVYAHSSPAETGASNITLSVEFTTVASSDLTLHNVGIELWCN